MELDSICYVIGHDIGEKREAVDINAILSDYAGRFDPEKLAAEELPDPAEPVPILLVIERLGKNEKPPQSLDGCGIGAVMRRRI